MTLPIKNLMYSTSLIPDFLRALTATQQKVAVIGHAILTLLLIELMKGNIQNRLKKIDLGKIKHDIQHWPIKENVERVKKIILDNISHAFHYIQNKFHSKPASLLPKKEPGKENKGSMQEASQEQESVPAELPKPLLPIRPIEETAPVGNPEKKSDCTITEQWQKQLAQDNTSSCSEKPPTFNKSEIEQKENSKEPISLPESAPPSPYKTPKKVGKGIASVVAKLNKQKGFLVQKEEPPVSQVEHKSQVCVPEEPLSSQVERMCQVDALPVPSEKLPENESKPSEEIPEVGLKLDSTAQKKRAALKPKRSVSESVQTKTKRTLRKSEDLSMGVNE